MNTINKSKKAQKKFIFNAVINKKISTHFAIKNILAGFIFLIPLFIVVNIEYENIYLSYIAIIFLFLSVLFFYFYRIGSNTKIILLENEFIITCLNQRIMIAEIIDVKYIISHGFRAPVLIQIYLKDSSQVFLYIDKFKFQNPRKIVSRFQDSVSSSGEHGSG